MSDMLQRLEEKVIVLVDELQGLREKMAVMVKENQSLQYENQELRSRVTDNHDKLKGIMDMLDSIDKPANSSIDTQSKFTEIL